MCPSSVHKVTKMRNSSKMGILIFYGSTLLDCVHIGPINLRARRFVSHPLQCFSCYGYGHGKSSCKDASRCCNCSALDSHSEEHCDSAAYCFHCRDAHQVRSRQCPRYRLEQVILQLANSQFISLGSACYNLLYRQKDGTGATSYASLAACSSAVSAGLKTSATFNSLVAGGPAVRLANRFALLSDDSVESSQRCDGNPPALTKVTHVVDVHSLPVSPKPLKGLTKQHRGSAESIDLAQPKQSKISPGAHDCESSSDRSAMVAPMVSVQPSVIPSVSDRASCEDGLSMESSDDIVTAVPRGPTVAKSVVQPDPRPPVTGRSDDNSHHSPVGRKAVVHRPGTPQLLVSSRLLIISSQVSHGQSLQKACPSTASK
ncbi:hypothetical protein E2C01_019607 [Portunus trituberculatus]|uniref:Nucleic-acid-binding protein from mobile element jockey n=1 Tax=Portunus trituberculatus TaxID=210409 RepID=A0A5B7DYE2_PORTR|nr:hypothetical protein [Portunus trituberculatus]